jgi:hypothetical protein
VFKHIDYWVICDTGSTDDTCEKITAFFEKHNIKGELHHDEWIGFGTNKTKMFEKCYKKTDFVIHFDADDYLNEEFTMNIEKHHVTEVIAFKAKTHRHSAVYNHELIYNNHYKWITVGSCHTSFICKDNDNLSYYQIKDNSYLNSTDFGDRSNDQDKYLKDAKNLENEFFNLLLHDEYNRKSRTVFYCAQSYYDSKLYNESYKWYSLYTNLKDTWIEEKYESYVRMAQCLINIDGHTNDIVDLISKSIRLQPERAEPYCILGDYFFHFQKYENAFFCFYKASQKSYEKVISMYSLFTNINAYNDSVLYKLALTSFYTSRVEVFNNLFETLRDDYPFLKILKNKLKS